MSQNNGQNGFSTKVMDDLMFSTMLPQKKLGGKFSKEPDTNTDGDLSVVFLGEEEDHCEKCSFKSKNINEMEKHKNNEHKATPIMIHSTGIYNTAAESVVQPRTKLKERKTHTESLKEKPKPKIFSSTKVLNNSFREKYLTGIKKLASLQEEHGGVPDFLLIVANNVQQPSKQTTTAGKFMVAGQGEIYEGFMHDGIEFDTHNYVKMSNNWSMQTQPTEEMEKLINERRMEKNLRTERRTKRHLVSAMEEQERDEERQSMQERRKRPRVAGSLGPEQIDQEP